MSKPLRIAVVAGVASPSLENIIRPALEKRGHTLDRIQPGAVPYSQLLACETVTALRTYDLVYYRTGFGVPGAYLVGKYLREHRIPCVNFFHEKHPYFLHKLYQTALVSAAGIRVPKTLSGMHCMYDSLAAELEVPFVAKADEGTHGSAVYKVDSPEALQRVQDMHAVDTLLYQTYIPHERDYRVHTIDGKATLPYARVPVAGDFRANVSLGGTMEKVPDIHIAKARSIAERVAQVFDVEIMGVDLLPHKETGELYFAEVNDNPGWKHVEELLGESPGEAVADLFEKRAEEGATNK